MNLFYFRQIGLAYVSSTTTAVAVSVGLNAFIKVMQQLYKTSVLCFVSLIPRALCLKGIGKSFVLY